MAVIPYTNKIYRGLSGDAKPNGIAGDRFAETDTGKCFVWTDSWAEEEQGGEGGVDVKCGNVAPVADNGSQAVTFNTPFSSTPKVVACFSDNIGGTDILEVGSVSTTGFTIYVTKGHGGAGHNHSVDWVATDAGNP